MTPRQPPAASGEPRCGLNHMDPGACTQQAIGVVAGDYDPLCRDHRLLIASRARGARGPELAAAERLRVLGCLVPEMRPEMVGVRA